MYFIRYYKSALNEILTLLFSHLSDSLKMLVTEPEHETNFGHKKAEIQVFCMDELSTRYYLYISQSPLPPSNGKNPISNLNRV